MHQMRRNFASMGVFWAKMANFNTHLVVALTFSASLAVWGFAKGAFGFWEMVLLVGVGMVGGLLPDIDLDSAKITRTGFDIASCFISAWGVFFYLRYHYLPPLDALIWWSVGVLILRFGVFYAFSRLTVHRGMVHSLPYMAAMALFLAYFALYGLAAPSRLAGFMGVFLFVGGLIHLLLDELYSVNIFGLKVKKSFGSAFKLFERKKLPAYGLLYALVLALLYLLPISIRLDNGFVYLN